MPTPASRQPPAPPPTAPRFAAVWAALVYAGVTCAFCWPAFTGAFLAGPNSDQFIGGYMVREFGTAMLRQTGHFPEWNPYLFGGMPYVGAMNGDIFYPPSLVLRLLLRPDVFVTWAFILHIFLAGWLTYLFLRTVGLGFAGALVGGMAYMMGGPIASYVGPGHDGKLYVSALLPLALLLLTYGIRDGRRWAWPVLSLTVGLAILTPHPQLLQYMLLGSGAYGLYLAFWRGRGAVPSRPIALRRLGTALGAVALGLAMGAIQFLPVAKYVAYSPRGGAGRGHEWAVSFSMPPEELINTYLPQFSGIMDNYWGRNGIHFHSEYLGAVVLVLAGCALIATPAERRREVRFWLILAIVATLWSLGGFTPFYSLVYVLVPGTKYFRAPSTMFFLAALAVAVLAGEGVDNVLRRHVRMRYALVWVGVAALIAVLAATGVLTTISAGLALPQLADRVQANASALTIGALRCLVFVVATAAVLMLVRDDKVPTGIAVGLIAVIVAADLWSVERMYWRFSAPAAVVYASDSATAYLQHQAQPGRVVAAPLSNEVSGRDPELEYDALMVHRIRQATGYHGNEVRRYDVLAGKDQGYQPLLTPQIWRLLNVQYFLTNVGTLKSPGLQLVVGPVRDASGTTLYLYRLPGDNPVAWVTPVSVKAPDDQALATVTDTRFDPLVAAVYDTAAPVAGQRVEKLPAPLGIAVTATRYDPGHMTFRLDRPAPAGASLIVSENFYPGWTATVDQKPAADGRADYTLIGVPLPAGATTVDLTFHDPAYAAGKVITYCAALIALGWWVTAVLVARRRHG
jgi:hypothetical protein